MNTIDRIADLSQIWKQAAQVFPYFDQNPIDWDQAYADYLSKVMAAKSERAYHLLLAEFMNLLGDGHTDYQLPRALQDENGYLPFTLRYVGGEYCVDAASERRTVCRGDCLGLPLCLPCIRLCIPLSAASTAAVLSAAHGQLSGNRSGRMAF